jgi:predicted deacylase
MMTVTELPPPPPPLPQFPVRLEPPDIAAWLSGNTGVRGFITRDSGRPGPHVGLVALTHGNEIAGAIAVERLLREELTPLRGRLTLGFANIAAFDRFDPRQPTASRFVDEDLNRIWSAELLDGPRRSVELDRAREMRSLVESFDILLDLHSMLWPSDPLILSGPSAKGRDLALAIGTPPLVVADRGHMTGPRMIDYVPFSAPDSPRAAVLVEAGQHWEEGTVTVTLACIAALLRHCGLARVHPALPQATDPAEPARFAEVTQAVTAATSSFAFLQFYRGGDVVPRRNTLIALDGTTEIRTPHDACLLVMPSLRPSRGHTAVRLARFA